MKKSSGSKRKRCQCAHITALVEPKNSDLYGMVVEKLLTVKSNLDGDRCGVHCIACGNDASGLEGHKAAHKGKRGHELVIDCDAGELFCTSCGDYVYLAEVDQEVGKLLVATRGASCLPGSSPDDTADKSIAQGSNPADTPAPVPTAHHDEKDDLGENTQAAVVAVDTLQQQQPVPRPEMFENLQAEDKYPAGLRGLNNMGHTCFMNSVLQVLLQAPLLRSHHLMNQHSRHSCSVTASGGHCVSCEMDDVFSAAYNGERTPHSPAAFLHAWWMLAGNLLGRYQQQDAHEFFCFVLEMMAVAGPGAPSENLAAKIFRGSMRSDVVCGCCGHTSTTVDPFTHISVDVPPPQTIVPMPIISRASAAANKNSAKPPINGAKAGGKSSKAANKKAAAAAAANNNKTGKLAGAALSSHLAKKKKGGPGAAADAASIEDITTADDSLSQDPAVSGSVQTHRPSPPLLPYTGSRLALAGELGMDATAGDIPSQLEMASVIGDSSEGGGNGSDEAARDTLTSPQPSQQQLLGGTTKAAATAATITNNNNSSQVGVTGTLGGAGAGTGLLSPGSVLMQHPQLAGYYKWPGASLVGCLRRFVREETLGANARWQCAKCESKQQAVKQLSILDLPPVLVIHAKRFEHSGDARATAKKLETYLSFPLNDLDLSGFLSSAVLRERHLLRPQSATATNNKAGAILSAAPSMDVDMDTTPTNVALANVRITRTRSVQSTSSRDDKLHAQQQQQHVSGGGGGGNSVSPAELNSVQPTVDKSDMMYDLYGVICHKGTFQGGHYVAYVKCSDGQWYLCDDAWITPVDKEVVRNCQGYMLFYAQQKLLPFGGDS